MQSNLQAGAGIQFKTTTTTLGTIPKIYYNKKCTEAQHTSPCVARHVPKRPSGAEANHRHSVIGSNRDSAASIDDVGVKGAVRGSSQPSTPRLVGEAGNKRDVRHGGGDTGDRTKAASNWMNLIAATFAAVLIMIFSIVEGEAVRMGIIRIYETAAATERGQHTSTGVARHVPKRQDGAEANHRHSVIGSNRDSAASIDDVGVKGAVRGYWASVWGNFDTGASP